MFYVYLFEVNLDKRPEHCSISPNNDGETYVVVPRLGDKVLYGRYWWKVVEVRLFPGSDNPSVYVEYDSEDF